MATERVVIRSYECGCYEYIDWHQPVMNYCQAHHDEAMDIYRKVTASGGD